MTNPADTPVDDPHTRRILDLVARGQARSRSELAATMGVAASTVGLRVQALLDAGV
ncbi:winged helix-turn-helix domain-containing protein, partial [Microbacterium sp. K41]